MARFAAPSARARRTADSSPKTGDASDAKAARGLDIDRMRAYVASRIHLLPHYRQRLARTPVQGHAIWVDDTHFDITYHVRPAALPRPGTDAQLKELTAQLVSQRLDTDRPLWELWLVEGLEDGGFAVIAKVHHCMVDGVSGVGVLQALLSPAPTTTIEKAPAWEPRPAPGVLDFLQDGVSEGARIGTSSLQSIGSSLMHPIDTASDLLETTSLGLGTLRAGLTPPGETPFNAPVGTQRRVDWRSLDLAAVRDVRKRLDGSVNDVVLAVVSGAIRRFLRKRRFKVTGLDLRVVVPVDMRTGEEEEGLGNRVSAWFLNLPVGERSPRKRFARIHEQTQAFKEGRTASSIDGFVRFADWAGSSRLTAWGVGLANWLRPYNLIVTNVHGPQVPLYLLGAPLVEFTPHIPLFRNQGLAVAALSYQSQIQIGLSADRDLVPDLERLGDAILESFAELEQSARSGR